MSPWYSWFGIVLNTLLCDLQDPSKKAKRTFSVCACIRCAACHICLAFSKTLTRSLSICTTSTIISTVGYLTCRKRRVASAFQSQLRLLHIARHRHFQLAPKPNPFQPLQLRSPHSCSTPLCSRSTTSTSHGALRHHDVTFEDCNLNKN